MLKISAILATDLRGAIGKDNELLYSYKEDMDFFRVMTHGKVIIMGYRTYQSIPQKGIESMAKRGIVLVLTKAENFEKDKVDIVANKCVPFSYGSQDEIEELFKTLKEEGSFIDENGIEQDGELIIVGGSSLYNKLEKLGVETLYLTLVKDKTQPEADTFFDMKQLDIFEEKEILEEHSMLTMFKFNKKATP